MNRKKAAGIAIVGVAVLGIAAWVLWPGGAQQPGTGTVVSGNVDADQVQVATLISGRVTSADIAEGDTVTAGDELYRIDSRALRAQLSQAKAAVRASRAAYEQARDDGESEADVAAAKAAWEQAKAGEEIARIQLSYATVEAPTGGTVTSVAVAEGELATTGRTLATITRTDSLFVRAFIPEPSLGRISIGDAVEIATDSGDTIEASVTFIASEAQFTPSNVETQEQRAKLVYEVRLAPEDAAGLTAGLPVTVTFQQ